MQPFSLCCGSVFTAADCVVEPVILGLPMHVLPIIFPKAHIPVRCENPPFSPSRSHKLMNFGLSLLHCHSLQFWCPFKDFRTAETIPRKIGVPTRRIVYRMCVRNASIPLQTPEPHRKDPSFYPFHLSTQLLDHLHPLTSPSRQPFSPSAHLPPITFLLSSYPSSPHPLISQP